MPNDPVTTPEQPAQPLTDHADSEEYSDPDLSRDDEDIIPPGLAEKRSCRGFPIPVAQLNTQDFTQEQIQVVSEAYDQATDFHEQVQIVARVLRADEPPMTFDQVGRIFKISRGTVFRHLSSEDWSEKPRGRPSLLSEDEIVKMRCFIVDQYDQKDPANLPHIADFLAIETGKVIAVETIRHIIGRLPYFKMIEGIPL
jgi:hypothetical protein